MNKMLRKQVDQKELLEKLVRDMATEDEAALKIKMLDPQPLVRLVATHAVGKRRLHYEMELIHQLADTEAQVREAAHQALVRISRGADFGPTAGAGPKDLVKAICAWQEWQHWQEVPLRTVAAADTLTQASPAIDAPAPTERRTPE
jgi:hypothetical protein